MGYVGKKSKYGDRPHKSDPKWGYTRQLIREWNIPIEVDGFISLWEQLGIADEISASEYCATHDTDIPQPE
jgi:hypothetical protein